MILYFQFIYKMANIPKQQTSPKIVYIKHLSNILLLPLYIYLFLVLFLAADATIIGIIIIKAIIL